MKKVAFITLGCKVNQYETNAMIQQFINKDNTMIFREYTPMFFFRANGKICVEILIKFKRR